MRGRKPKPTHLRLVAGNAGHRPINQREPKPAGKLTSAPEFLTESQRAIWDYAIANAPSGLLKLLDRDVLLSWVIARDLWETAVRQQNKIDANNGLALLSRTKNGELQQSPYLPIINKQASIMLKCGAEMGFTPSSRSRIELDPNHEEDPAEKYFT